MKTKFEDLEMGDFFEYSWTDGKSEKLHKIVAVVIKTTEKYIKADDVVNFTDSSTVGEGEEISFDNKRCKFVRYVCSQDPRIEVVKKFYPEEFI